MRRPSSLVAAMLALALGLAGCADAVDDPGSHAAAIAEPGPWQIPPDTLAAGDVQYVEFTGAGPWTGPEGCHGGLTSGAAILRDYLGYAFPQITMIGGYACRAVNGSTTTMSVHATGRALDIFIPVFGSEQDADNGLGDPVGNWIIENAEPLGVQYVIWDRQSFMTERPAGDKSRPYTGASPHYNHLHVELSVEAAAQTADWFSAFVPAPPPLLCPTLPPEGGVIDERSPCFEAFGPSAYYRVIGDEGYDGALLYTNAWATKEPSNFATWTLALAAGGRYEVEVFLSPPYNVHPATRYEIQHAAGSTVVELDQSAASGFVSLGAYDFAADGSEWVAVYDTADAPVDAESHIAIDALRLVRLDGDDGGVPAEDGGVDGGGVSFDVRASARCAVSAAPGAPQGPAGDAGLFLGLAVVALVTRRCRRAGRARA